MANHSFANRYSKRKRQAVSYVEFPDEDEEFDVKEDTSPSPKRKKPEPDVKHGTLIVFDDDGEFGKPKPKKPKRKMLSPAEKALRQKIKEEEAFRKMREAPFRFMDLPPELRNLIYDLCLRDPDGVHIKSVTGLRRYPQHCAPAACKSQYGARSWWAMQHAQPLDPNATVKKYYLNTKLLAVSKTIYDEASPILYNQMFYLADPFALQSLILSMGPIGAAKLKKLTIMHWSCPPRSTLRGVSLHAFTMLRDVTSLQKLHIKANMDWFAAGKGNYKDESVDPERALVIAKNVYRDSYPLMEVLAAKGGVEKMMDVVDISDVNLRASLNFLNLDEDVGAWWSKERRTKMLEMVFAELFRLVKSRA